MASKTIVVSAINHVPSYEDPGLPPLNPHPMDIPKTDIGCSIHYELGAPQQIFTFSVCDQVKFGEDFTASFDVPDNDPRGVEFFWHESIGGQTFRHMAWYDRPREEFGKHWGWVGMFWLFDAAGDSTYERLACGIALSKIVPWPPFGEANAGYSLRRRSR